MLSPSDFVPWNSSYRVNVCSSRFQFWGTIAVQTFSGQWRRAGINRRGFLNFCADRGFRKDLQEQLLVQSTALFFRSVVFLVHPNLTWPCDLASAAPRGDRLRSFDTRRQKLFVAELKCTKEACMAGMGNSLHISGQDVSVENYLMSLSVYAPSCKRKAVSILERV
jgi:hypothetical protein